MLCGHFTLYSVLCHLYSVSVLSFLPSRGQGRDNSICSANEYRGQGRDNTEDKIGASQGVYRVRAKTAIKGYKSDYFAF